MKIGAAFGRLVDGIPVALDSPLDIRNAAIHLLLAPTSGPYPDEVYVLQRGARSCWSDGPRHADRRHFASAIRIAVAQGRRVVHLVSGPGLARTGGAELFRRYAELQRLPGDYELTRDDSTVEAGVTDTIVRPGVGVLHCVATDPVKLTPTEGDLFPFGGFEDYVERRSRQASLLARAKSSPFIVHDPSGRFAVGDRRVRVEAALVDIERINGPRILLKDGPSDLLAPRAALEAMLDSSSASATDVGSDYWRSEVRDLHERRLISFRDQIGSNLFTEFVPLSQLERYSRGVLARHTSRPRSFERRSINAGVVRELQTDRA